MSRVSGLPVLAVIALLVYTISTSGFEDPSEPKDAAEFVRRGNDSYSKGKIDEAIKDYTEALRLNPKSRAALMNRGRSWADKDEYDKAIRDYTACIEMDETNATAFVRRSGCWIEKKDYDKAIADCETAMRL